MAVILKWKEVKLIWIICLILISLPLGSEAQEFTTYEVPQEMFYSAHNDDFTVQVKKTGGQWKDLYEYNVKVDMDTNSDASMVYFDFSGKVEVAIRKNNGMVHNVKVRPSSYGIKPEIEGEMIYLTLEQPRKLSIEVNGNRLNNLHLFANSIEENRPDSTDPNVMYFGPGLHETPGDTLQVESNTTVYLHGGAVLKSKLICNEAENIHIKGRGLVWQPHRGVEIRHCSNVTVEGVTFVNPEHYTIYGGAAQNLTVRNIKSFSNQGWSDGIDMMASSDVVIDGVFMRNSDDCIAIYGHRWDFYGNARNIEVKNSTLWADIAHPINMATHGNAEAGGDTLSNITFTNLDILEQDEDDRNYQGTMAISDTDNNLVKDLRFENIRIEDIQEGMLLNFRTYYNEDYSHAPGRGIHNVVLKDIQLNASHVNPSVIRGYSDQRNVEGITIQNLRINGKLIMSAEEGNIQIGDYTEDITFEK